MVNTTLLIIKPFLVTAAVKSRTITIKGPRGTLTKTFKHIKVEITHKEEDGAKFLELNCYLNTYKQSAIIFTISSHIKNMIKGVTKGFRYKMHIVKKHFPIDITIAKTHIEIRRFLGERSVKTVKLLEGVSCAKNEKNNEELWFDGNDIDKVSLTCKDSFFFDVFFFFF
jgi:large subunit ribosomal protein L9e